MKETPQRTRSYASPTRDKIFIWSAVVAGCGIMALLGRHAAIHRFGTDQFTGNVLFAVFFVLSIGLYCGFQSVIEDLFNRLSALFRRREVIAIAETPTGEKVSVSTTDVQEIQEQCSTPIPETACVAENKGESKVVIPMNENRPFEVLEIVDDMRHIRFPDGEEAYVGMELSDDEILIEKSYNDSRDYDAELEEAYNVYLDSMTDEERYDWKTQSRMTP